jgi:hypothetical protein
MYVMPAMELGGPMDERPSYTREIKLELEISDLQAKVTQLEQERDGWRIAMEGLEREHKALIAQIPADRIDADQILIDRVNTAAALEKIGRQHIKYLQAKVAQLEQQLEQHAWTISPAMAQAQIDALQAKVEQLEAQLAACVKDREMWHADASSHLSALCEKQAEVNGLERDLAASRQQAVAMAEKFSDYLLQDAMRSPNPDWKEMLHRNPDYQAAQAVIDQAGHVPQSGLVWTADEAIKLLRDEHAAVKWIVRSEEELPGHMPDEMWTVIANDRGAVEEAMRIAVRQTKENILAKLTAREK